MTEYQKSQEGKPPNPENIPAELKQDPSWVCWKYEKREASPGKQTKVPYQPSGRLAKSNDPKTFSTFEAVMKASGAFAGIGFVFHKDNPYCGADFDDVTTEQAREWLERFDS